MSIWDWLSKQKCAHARCLNRRNGVEWCEHHERYHETAAGIALLRRALGEEDHAGK